MPAAYLLGGLLIVLSSLLMVWHAKMWDKVRSMQLPAEELQFRWKQFRRRAIVSILLASAGLAVLASQFTQRPIASLALWFVVALLVASMMVLALLDMRATAAHIDQLRRIHRADRDRLMAEMREIGRGQGNGQADSQGEGASDES